MSDERDAHRKQLEGFFRDDLRAAEVEAPSFDELAAYVEDRLSPAERAELEERIAGDEVVRREVELLRELRGEMARTPKASPAERSWTWTALAAAAAIAAIASWLVVKPGPGPDGGPRPTAPSPAPLATLSDGGERIVLSADGTLGGLSAVEPGLRQAVAAALRGELPPAPDLASLRAGGSALMGPPGGPAAFAPEAPVATRVASGRPTFRWSAHPDATAYDVKVFDADFREQAAGLGIVGTEWQPAQPLAAGRVYVWQVSARTPRGRVTAPAAPQPEARFAVADDALLARVAERRQGAQHSHLVAALAFLDAGLLDDADTELKALAEANQGVKAVATLRDRLRAMR